MMSLIILMIRNNALIIAGLNLANKSRVIQHLKMDSDVSFKKLLSKIEDALEK